MTLRRNTNGRKEGSARILALHLRQLEDAELVELVENGSREAFEVLVERYEALVRAVVARFIQNDTMALEDACQETFLRALAKLGDLRNRSRFKSWLCAIARNQALDSSRRRRLLMSLSWETDGDQEQVRWQIPDRRLDPSEQHARVEVAALVRSVLRDMPELYRDPIRLRFEEELDYSEIAILLDKPLGTIKSLIHRGKALMKKELVRRSWGVESAQALAS